MKRNIKNCLAATALSLILLAIVANLYNAKLLCITSIYQVFTANIAISLGLYLLKHFESQYFIVEILVEIGYIISVLISAGALFGWYSSTPIWLLVIMGIVVYVIGSLIDVFRINNDLKFINSQLELHKKRTVG